MKARPFLASLLAVLLLTLSLAAAGWWLIWQRSPLQLQHRPLVLPRAARFIPRDAPLALHLLTDGREPVGYARAVAPSRDRRQAADALERLRDGAFAAAGLDYRNELAGWLAPEISLALFERPGSDPREPAGNWLLALRSRDGDGARRFLQRFWQTRSLAGTDLQVTNYRGMGLISGRGALMGRQPVPLATALIDDDLLLIASGRGVLEEALDVSQIDELNQAADPGLRAGVERLASGVALLVADAGQPLLQLPDGAGRGRLLASLRPEGTSLWLQALIARPPDPELAATRFDHGLRRPLLAVAPQRTTSLTLLQDPDVLRRDPLLRSLVDQAVQAGPDTGPLPSLILREARGPLAAIAMAHDWLLATPAAQPSVSQLEAPLASDGLIAAPLELKGRSATVWTRLEPASVRGGRDRRDSLQAPVEGWRGERDGLAVWGRSLALLEGDGEARGAWARERQLEALDAPQAPFQWALADAAARALLAHWAPWRRLAGLAGGPLDGRVSGLELAVEPGADALLLRARLELAGRG
ncbi:MAG: DUF3352 domain-containing protein [Cyanobium sp.]